MRHGIDGYFQEQRANLRRLALLAPLVGAAFAAALTLLGMDRESPDPVMVRFGYEGVDEYVRRIRLEAIGPVEQAGLTHVKLSAREARKGGGDAPAQMHSEGARARAAPRVGDGLGADDEDLLARARAMQLDAPVIRSQELVIAELVRPVYPEEAQANNVEGVVEVLALVDTTGTVQQAQIIGGTGHTMLERAATDAVLQCRYRPWRHNGRAERVYAAFRIRFSLY